MVEIYERVNWNKDMFVNPTNMNQMDKGIADNNEAVELLERSLDATQYGIAKDRSVFMPIFDPENMDNHYGYVETRNGSTIYRNQLDSDGVTRLYKSTDGGATWSSVTYSTSGITIISDCNDATENGILYYAPNVANVPEPNTFIFIKTYGISNEILTQIGFSINSNTDKIFTRRKVDGVWQPWMKFSDGNRFTDVDNGTYTRVNSPNGNIQLMNNVDVYAPDGASWRAVSASAFNTISSIKYKENVKDMTDEEAKKILELRPVTFDYKNDGQKGCLGFIAEEVEEVETYPCSYKDGEIQGIDYSKFVPQLIKLVQMQQKEIDDLKKKVGAE